METIYKYIIRPAEGTQNTLLIFLDLPENGHFIQHVIKAFSSVNLQLTHTVDLWVNDELIVKATSDIGEFSLFRDQEDYYSISGSNQAILTLDKILGNNPEFLKSE